MHTDSKQVADEVRDVLAGLGLALQVLDGRAELDVDGRSVSLALTRASVVSPRTVPGEPADDGLVHVLVADRISDQARSLLTATRWSWLDLRGHLRLRAPGVVVDTAFAPSSPLPAPRAAGRAWREVAFALLREPDRDWGVRPLARELGLSASATSGALAQLRDASLLDRRGRPLVPEAFWALAERWQVERVPLRRPPGPADDDLEVGRDGTGSGWALTDTLAAAALGAPLAPGTDWPPDLYVPSAVVLRRAVRALGQPADWDTRGATAAVPPVQQACLHRRPADGTAWPLADPLVVALDLAQDSGRGLEVLRDWKPSGFVRVWS